MQAFQVFYKIVPRKFLKPFIIYTLIFVGLMSFLTSSFSQDDIFELSKVRVTVINHDNTPLANGLEEFINSILRPVEINIDEDSIKDALFFRETEFVVTIPQGFESSFISSNPQKISTMSVPDSTSSHYARTIIDKYLNTAIVYMEAFPEMPIVEINEKVLRDISKEVRVSFLDRVAISNLTSLNLYFNFLAYLLIAMLTTMIARIMLIFNNKEIKMRNYCAPISSKKYNYQLILGNLTIAFAIWLIFIALSFYLNKDSTNQTGAFIFVINSFILMILSLSIGFFVSSFATHKSIEPLAMCFSLGLSFLGGAFVPQFLLNERIRNIGNFNPVFWYVKVNDTIGDLTGISMASLQPIIYGMLVQLAFAFALLAIALVIIKQKQQSL